MNNNKTMDESGNLDSLDFNENEPLVTDKAKRKETNKTGTLKTFTDLLNRQAETNCQKAERGRAERSKNERVTEADLDDVDGAMFSRQRTGQHNNKTPTDNVDGAMFSRYPVFTTDGKRKQKRLRVELSITGNNIGNQLSKSPSADFLHTIRFSELSKQFPTAPFSSTGNLFALDQPMQDIIDYGVDVPEDFDAENCHSKNNPQDKTANISDNGKRDSKYSSYDDESDSALFNRVNSCKNKDSKPDKSETVEKLLSSEALCNGVIYSKSLPDMRCPATPQLSSRYIDPPPKILKQNQKQSSKSLPEILDTDQAMDADLIPQGMDNEQTILEEIITRETVSPLTGPLQYRNSRVSRTAASPVDDARTNLLIEDDQPSGSTRRPFRCKHCCAVILPTISILLFLIDIGTDIKLAMRYKREGDTLFFIVTLLCIVLPAFLMSIVDLSWICLDKTILDDHYPGKCSCYTSRCWKVTRFLIGLLCFGRVARTIAHIYHSVCSKLYDDDHTRALHKNRKIEERRDYSMLDVINAFTESCPQLIAQMVLIYTFKRPFNADLGFSIISSWLSIGWAYSCYYRYQKEVSHGRNDVKLSGVAVFCLAVLSALATRICCISLFIVYFHWWISVIAMLAHFSLMFLWIAFCQKPKLEGLTRSKFWRYVYYLFFSYLSIVYFINLKDDRSRYRLLAYFGIYYVENFVVAGLMFWQISSYDGISVREYRWSLLIVPLGMALHILLLTLYYKCMHPHARKEKGNENMDMQV